MASGRDRALRGVGTLMRIRDRAEALARTIADVQVEATAALLAADAGFDAEGFNELTDGVLLRCEALLDRASPDLGDLRALVLKLSRETDGEE